MTNQLNILAVGVHPDDIELGCAGTLCKHIAQGHKVSAIDLTQGELGTRGSAAIRLQEADAAANIMGLASRVNLEFEDGFVTEDNKDYLMKLIVQIRALKPDMVLCNAIEDRHPDHSRAAKLVAKSCFLAGLPKIETSYEGVSQEAWRPKQVLHYIQWLPIEPDVLVDISGYINQKVDAVKAYKSQFYDPKSNEPTTPISSQQFLDSITYRASDLGRLIGVEYAEGFTSERPIAISSLADLI